MEARVIGRRVTTGVSRLVASVISILARMADGLQTTASAVAPPTSSVLNPPESLKTLQSRVLFFLSYCALLVGAAWFAVCVLLYVVGLEYHIMNVMYECRWLPCTIIFSGILAALLGVWKNETFYIGCAFSAVYSLPSCLIVVIVYALDFRKAYYQMHPPITTRMAGYPRKRYLELCACMIAVASFGFAVGVLILVKLWQIASWYYSKINFQRKQRSYIILSAIVQLPLIWFSIYVTSHVISLPFSYVQQYMIQELLCALTLKAIVVIQALHCVRGNRLTLKLLLILNGCQTVQEIFYTWNSYYISLYIHTSKSKLALGAQTDQYLMTANFVGHFVRMCIVAYTTYSISTWLQAPFVSTYCRVELDRKARQVLVLLALITLILAAGHVIMDVLYTITSHIYRTLIAFTGISVFYSSLTGVCLALFVRSGHMLLLVIATVFMLLLAAVSVHAVYIYIDTSYQNSLFSHLEAVGNLDTRESSYMHFTEAFLAFLALILCLIGGVFIFRLLHIDSVHDRRDGRLKTPLLTLFALGIGQLELATVNAALIVSIRDDSNVFQAMLAYGVLDSISIFILCLTQIYVCWPSNTHVSYGLTALLLFLTCEVLTTYNYLSTKTTYVQLLIVFSRMFNGSPTTKQSLSALFPADDVGLMVAAHIVQLVQALLNVTSLVLTGLALEKMYEQRKELASAPNSTPMNAAAAAATGTSVSTVAAPIPAVSYTVSKKDTRNSGRVNGQKPKPSEVTRNGQETDQGPFQNGITIDSRSFDNHAFANEDRQPQAPLLESATGGVNKRGVGQVVNEKNERGELLPHQSADRNPGESVEESKDRLIGKNEEGREEA